MLIHKSYINVAIAKILMYLKSFYDLQEPRYGKSAKRGKQKWAWPILRGPPIDSDSGLFFGINRHHNLNIGEEIGLSPRSFWF